MKSIIFDGENHRECLKFIEGKFDNSLNYPNIKTLNGIKAVYDGDEITKDENGNLDLKKDK